MIQSNKSAQVLFLEHYEIPHRIGTPADGTVLVGEPIIDREGIEKLVALAINNPDLEKDSEPIYGLMLWAKSMHKKLISFPSGAVGD